MNEDFDWLRGLLNGLLKSTGAGRVTLRIEPESARSKEVGVEMPVVCEVVAPGVPAMMSRPSLDITEGPTLPYLASTLDLLVVEDCDTSPYAPPATLRSAYGVDSEMLGPLSLAGRLVGMVSVHHCDGPRTWTQEDVAALRSCMDEVRQRLGLD